MLNRLKHLEARHWGLVAAFLVSTLTVTAGLDHWRDLWENPALTSGILMQLVTLIGAIFAGAPLNPNLNGLNNPARRVMDPKPPDALGSVTESTRSKL